MLPHAGERLKGKRAAILAVDGFEYVELILPRKALEAEGADVDVLSLHGGRIRGMNLTEPTRTVRVDRDVHDASPDEYDALLIPGGFVNPDFLRQSRAAREFVRAFDRSDKPIATLCHGPWLLVSAELVVGRELAAWPSLRDDIVHAGGIWRDEPLVRDRNWVSSRGPQDLPAFLPGMIELFGAEPSARRGTPIRADLLDPRVASSPEPDEPVPAVLAVARFLPGPTLRTLIAGALAAAAGALVLRRTRP